ncbi:MAG: hypothetical protein KAU17_03590 [Spirochaetales bacterium]|jgi:hypothetical protein|nr:hypothetical protein [Spirochaetales bacterium]
MFSTDYWNILGYDQQYVPNTYYKNKPNNDRLAIVLPGFGYSTSAPLLFYLKELLFQRSNDILSVDYSYNRNPDFLKADEDTQDRWFHQDIDAVYSEVIRHLQYKELILMGYIACKNCCYLGYAEMN